jgi:hypothetical protein
VPYKSDMKMKSSFPLAVAHPGYYIYCNSLGILLSSLIFPFGFLIKGSNPYIKG